MSNFVNTIDVLGDSVVFDSIVDGSIVEFADNVITTVRNSQFQGCANLVRVDLPSVNTIAKNAFSDCSSLTSVNLPAVLTADSSFGGCTSLVKLCLPLLTQLNGTYVFNVCTNLTIVDLPKVTSIRGGYTFRNCTNMKALILRSDTVCALTTANLNNTSMRIYVPSALVSEYQAATNWSAWHSAQFRALEDYTVDGTVTGELDESKI